MTKLSSLQFLNELNDISKSYFTIADLKQIFALSTEALYVACSRLVKKGLIYRLKNNIYTLDNSPQNIQKIANVLNFPSYLSLESALALFGILNQIPYTSTFVSRNKTQTIVLGEQSIEYHQICPELFFGYTLEKDLYIALPEKALLDQLYFVSLGKAKLDFDELNLHEVSKTKFLRWSKKFPGPAQKQAQKLVKQFGKISVTIK